MSPSWPRFPAKAPTSPQVCVTQRASLGLTGTDFYEALLDPARQFESERGHETNPTVSIMRPFG